MRFLADENFPEAAVAALLLGGCEVGRVREFAPGAADHAVLEHAVRMGAILLTFDKDFGELASRFSAAAGFGVVLFRIPMPRAADAGRTLAQIVQSRDDWEGHFSVIEPGRLRMRALKV